MAQLQISDEERAAFKQVFDCLDFNKDGHITSKEVKEVLKHLGMNPPDEEVKEFIETCDTDKNNTIDFSEFCSYLVDMRRKIFNEIDTDGNGYITPDEVVAGYKKLGVEITLENAKAIVDESDTDKDGRISYDEFAKSMQDRPLI